MYSTGWKYEFTHSHSISLSFIYSSLRICTVIKWQLGGLEYDFDTDKLSRWFQSVWEELRICFSPKHWQDCTTTMEVWRSRSLSSPHRGQRSLMGTTGGETEMLRRRGRADVSNFSAYCNFSPRLSKITLARGLAFWSTAHARLCACKHKQQASDGFARICTDKRSRRACETARNPAVHRMNVPHRAAISTTTSTQHGFVFIAKGWYDHSPSILREECHVWLSLTKLTLPTWSNKATIVMWQPRHT